MDHEPVFISTIAIGLTAALIGGLIARHIRLPAIVGYIVAGVAIGPFTPGLIADTDIALELAELGVILLMFGVGIHFSIRDLLAVRSIAVPGAIIQTIVSCLFGVWLGSALGWGVGGGLVLGLALSIASTVVLLRAMTDRQELDTPEGRIAVGWLIVEDLLAVFVLVLLPTVAPLLGGGGSATGSADPTGLGSLAPIGLALAKAVVFTVVMVVVGARLVPWLLLVVAREGSRELFTLAVLAIALGIAFIASTVFGVSFALGAFIAGLIVGESDMSHQAAADALPLRDAFAVLFFVSVGMLLDPAFVLQNPLPILAIVLLVVGMKAVTKFFIVVVAGYPTRVALTVAAGLAQIGEFSFIVGTVGRSLGLLPEDGFQLIVAGALLSITLNPLMLRAIEPLEARLRATPAVANLLRRRAGELGILDTAAQADLRQHAILSGYGRVGRMIGPALERRGFKYVVVTQQRHEVDGLRARGVPAVFGDAANAEVLEMAQVQHARELIVATSDPHETRLIVERAQALQPGLDIIVRTHSDTEAAYLRAMGGKIQVVHGERELAVQMARYALRRFGVSSAEAEAIAQGLRNRAVGTPAGAQGGGVPAWLRMLRDVFRRPPSD